MIPTPAPFRSVLQSLPCDSQFHWPRTKIVTVPSPLSTALPLIVPRIGLPASASAPATRKISPPASAAKPTVKFRRRRLRPFERLMRPPSFPLCGTALPSAGPPVRTSVPLIGTAIRARTQAIGGKGTVRGGPEAAPEIVLAGRLRLLVRDDLRLLRLLLDL